jgi:GT2 family glycosyltransferase
VHILLVDNGSADDSLERFRRTFAGRSEPAVTVFETGANLGFAAGMNTGIRHALAQGARSVLLLNNDTLVDGEMLRHLAGALAVEPAVGLAGPAIYYHAAPGRVWRAADNEHPWLPIPLRVPDRVVTAPDGAPFPADYITACAMLVRAEVFRHIGYLDEQYFMYFEDADFCRRARAAGFGIRCVPRAKMWHKVSLSANKEKAANCYARAWGRVRFYQAHPHGPLAPLVHPYIWGKVLAESLSAGVRGEWRMVKPLWRGTVAGYRRAARLEQAPYDGRKLGAEDLPG